MNLLLSFEIIEALRWVPPCGKWQEVSEVEEKHDRVLR